MNPIDFTGKKNKMIPKESITMRIISGKARGTKLNTLEGLNTRPTLDRVKESFFNILQDEIIDCTFLDLFSGSGAIGLEAASRGAKKVILCEKQKEASKIIEKNIEKTHLKENVILYQMDFQEVLRNQIKERLDLIYLDPPYDSDYAEKAIRILEKNPFIDTNTKIIVETDQPQDFLKKIERDEVEIIQKRKYGRACLVFLKKKKAE